MNRMTNHVFRLYIAGEAPNSLRAQTNLTEICKSYLPGIYQIEIIDVIKSPELALKDNVLMTPMLIRISPAPVCKIVGSLSDMLTTLRSLGIEVAA